MSTTAAIATLREVEKEPSRSDSIVEATRNADEPAELDTAEVEHAAREAALGTLRPVTVNTHSQAFMAMLMAQQIAMKDKRADLMTRRRTIDAEIADLDIAENAVEASIAAIKR